MHPTRLLVDDIRPEEGFYASVVDSPRRLPVLTFLPTGYEPNYPYPLVVFFHGHGGNEEQILSLAPHLSRRNYICLALRGPQVMVNEDDGSERFGWTLGGRSDAFAEEYVFEAIEQTQRNYHVHTERIYLAGFCEGGPLAYRLGLAYPTKFGGVAVMNGQLPTATPLLRWPEARHLPVLMGHGIANATIPLSTAKRDFRLLYTAGLNIQFRTYPTTHRIHADMLRDINRWIMQEISE